MTPFEQFCKERALTDIIYFECCCESGSGSGYLVDTAKSESNPFGMTGQCLPFVVQVLQGSLRTLPAVSLVWVS